MTCSPGFWNMAVVFRTLQEEMEKVQNTAARFVRLAITVLKLGV